MATYVATNESHVSRAEERIDALDSLNSNAHTQARAVASLGDWS